jgi:hypothetical protein
VNTGQLARRGGKPKPQIKKETSYWMDGNNSAPKLVNGSNGSSSSAGVRTPTPTPTPPPAPALDKGKGREGSPAPRVDKGKAREVIPENPFSPRNERRQSLTEEILSPGAAAAAQRRRDELAGMGSPRGGSFGIGNNNDRLSNLISMGGMGGRTVGGSSGPIRSGNSDPLSGLLGGMGGMGGMGGLGGMGGRTVGTPSPPPPTSGGRPLGSPIQQTVRAPPQTGRAGGRLGGMSGMAGLESLLGGLGGLGPGGGLGGMGGGFDPGMFNPDFFGPGSNKDKSDEGKTDTEDGGDDTPRSGTWSGTGLQSNLSDSA